MFIIVKGWSFKNRYLILTNKPRIFYTTPQGHFKGLIPWSMTEPIQITKVRLFTLLYTFFKIYE